MLKVEPQGRWRSTGPSLKGNVANEQPTGSFAGGLRGGQVARALTVGSVLRFGQSLAFMALRQPCTFGGAPTSPVALLSRPAKLRPRHRAAHHGHRPARLDELRRSAVVCVANTDARGLGMAGDLSGWGRSLWR